MTLEQLKFVDNDIAEKKKDRVLLYCYMREANILRQLGQMKDALSASSKEMSCTRSSGDAIALGRSIMSNGATYIATGDTKNGVKLVEESRAIFESGDTYNHRQGLGWSWIL